MARIAKSFTGHNTALFVALTPNVEDRNGDIISEDEIIKTAHEFMINLAEKKINVDHEEDTDLTSSDAQFVESFIAPVDLKYEDFSGNGYTIEKGSWLVGIKFSDELFQKILDGKITGISIEGQGWATDI